MALHTRGVLVHDKGLSALVELQQDEMNRPREWTSLFYGTAVREQGSGPSFRKGRAFSLIRRHPNCASGLRNSYCSMCVALLAEIPLEKKQKYKRN